MASRGVLLRARRDALRSVADSNKHDNDEQEPRPATGAAAFPLKAFGVPPVCLQPVVSHNGRPSQ